MKEFLARLNPTERRFVVGVAVVFFLVVNIVWVWPHFGDWGRTEDALGTARGLLLKFETGTNNIPTLQREIARYSGQGMFVPPENQMLYFFRQIQNQAAVSGVGILNMGSTRQTTAADNPFFVEQNQTITVQSGEKQLVDFLYRLGAESNSLIRVKVLQVSPDGAHQNLNAHVTLVASYQKKAPTAPAKTAAPAPAGAAPKPAAPTVAAPPAQKPPLPNPAVAKPNIPAAPKPLLPFPGRGPATNAHNPLMPNKT